MSAATVTRLRPDPFADLDGATMRDVLVARGWVGVETSGVAGLSCELSEVVAVVVTGKAGERNLARLVGAHGDLPPAPRFTSFARTEGAEPRTLRFFRQPDGARAISAANLHGAVPGVSVLASGREALPPSVIAGVQTRWQHDTHPSVTPLVDLPRWLVEMSCDPAAAHRAWGTARPTPAETKVLAAWEQLLTRVRGGVSNSFGNVCTILRASPKYSGRLVFNELMQGATLDGRSVTDGALGRIREEIERDHGVSPAVEALRLAVQTVAEERRVHPVRDYLAGLKWDGTARLDAVAGSILGAAEPLAALMVRRFFVGAVARVLRPGCKLDTALVLVGEQGAQKSTFYSVAGGDWFTDTHVDLGSKDAYMQLAGALIVEWGEIERVTSRRGADEIKSFLSSRVDRFRPPYGRGIVEVPRTCVLVGSTNQTTFLDDDTGSRRFWCVRVPRRVDIELLKSWRDQLWAEAVALFEGGEPWWLNPEDEGARAADAEQHAIEDAWTAPVLTFLAKRSAREDFTAGEVLHGAIDLHQRDHDRASTARVGRILRAAGWERRKHRPFREGARGEPVWCWFRPKDPNAPRFPEVDDDPPFLEEHDAPP